MCFFLAEEKGNPIKEQCRARMPSGAFKGLFVRSKIKSHCLKKGMFDGAGIIGLITVQGAYLEEETGRGEEELISRARWHNPSVPKNPKEMFSIYI